MSKGSKKTQIIATLVALALLGLYYYIFEVRKPKDEEVKNEAAQQLFSGLKRADINEFDIKNRYGAFTIKKEGDTWFVTGPIKDFADDMTVDGLLSVSDNKLFLRKIIAPEMKDYGLARPPITMDIKTVDNRSFTVYVGDKNPTGGLVYVAKPGDPDVYIVEANMHYLTDKNFFDLRYRGLLKMNKDKVNRITVDVKGKKYTAQKDGNAWNLVDPVKSRIKKEKIDTLISNFTGTSLKGFQPAGGEGRYGTATSVQKVEFFEDGGKKHTAVFGNFDSKGLHYYVKTNRLDEIAEAPEYIYQYLPALEEMVNKQVIVFEVDDVKKTEVSWDDKLLEFTKQKKPTAAVDTWEITKNKNVDNPFLRDVRMSNVIYAIYNLDYMEAYKPEPGLSESKEYGIGVKNYTIRLFGDGGRIIGTLVIGRRKEEGRSIGYVKVPERNMYYLVDATNLDGVRMPGSEMMKK